MPALKQAASSSDLEVRWRARQLIELWRTEEFYAISEQGRLFRLTVGKDAFQSEDIAKLGEPFNRPDVCVEGLAMSRQGMLYASVVFRSDETEKSLLYRIDPSSGATQLLGLILPAEVTGLDFGPDGRLYGVLSSCRHSSLTGQTHLVEIDPAAGKASATPTAITHRNLNGLAIDKMGRAILSNGSCGLFQVELKSQSTSEPFLADESFCTQMGGARIGRAVLWSRRRIVWAFPLLSSIGPFSGAV